MTKPIRRLIYTAIGMLFIGLCIIACLWTLKYIKTQKEDIMYYGQTLASPQDHIYFAVGNVDDYPVMIKMENEGVWLEVYPKPWIFTMLPIKSDYGNFQSVNGTTIWITESESCSECNHMIYGIYYSHDTGQSWRSIPIKYLRPHTWLHFFSSIYGELSVPQDDCEECSDYYHTHDGGKNWKPGRLENDYKLSQFANATTFFYLSTDDSNKKGYETYKYDTTKINVKQIPSYSRIKK